MCRRTSVRTDRSRRAISFLTPAAHSHDGHRARSADGLVRPRHGVEEKKRTGASPLRGLAMSETLPVQPWMAHPATVAVMAALEAAGGEDCARFVGGCVRNALLRPPV